MIGGAVRWEYVINLEDNIACMVRDAEVRATVVRAAEVESIVVKYAAVRTGV